MDAVRRHISNFGIFLVLAAIVSAVLQLVGYELRMLRALHDQPPLIAWGIRAGLLVVGIALCFAGPKDATDEAGAAPAPTPFELAQDPRMQWLVGWVGHQLGATLGAQPGYPRIAHLTFWNGQGLPTVPHDPAVAQAVAYVDSHPQGRLCVVGNIAAQQAQAFPATAAAWDYNVPG
jgi:hypothetical protein